MVIRQSLLSLLESQTIDKITVADICRLSEINRATCYRHYENQYSVLFELEDDLLNQIQPAQEAEAFLEAVFGVFQEKREEWGLLLATHADQGFSDRLYRFFLERLPLIQPSPRRELRHSFLLHGLSGLLIHWAERNFREPAREMADCAIQLLHDLMSGGEPSLI